MLTLTLALRTLLKRKARMVLIGILVAFGTFLLVFGGVFSASAKEASRNAIIENFTGDFILYSKKSKELPSPFAFNTPLPVIRNTERIEEELSKIGGIKTRTWYAQNYGLIEVEKDGEKTDLPFIFYAIQPDSYKDMFDNAAIKEGSFFGPGATERGILISAYQNAQYKENSGIELKTGQSVRLLGVTEGGANTVSSTMLGIFEPIHYSSVFNYINFMDAETYTELYNYTGVESLPDDFNAALAAATADEDSLFALAGDDDFGKIDVDSLTSQRLSGYTMLAVRLDDSSKADEIRKQLESIPDLDIKTASWEEASGFYAQISLGLQAFIFFATTLIFLIVIMIFMNTLIINVVERTGEIGTMRAIGAEKSFIRNMFLAETLILNTCASLIGMAAAAILLAAGSANGILLPDIVSQFLIGGGPVPVTITPAPFIIAFAAVIAVSVLATVYPVSVATTITPLKAMNDR